MSEDIKPWARQPGEPRQAYHAFCHYRDQPSHSRTGSRAFLIHQVECLKRAPKEMLTADPAEVPLRFRELLPRWKLWKKTFRWEERADAHDAEVAEQDRRARADAIVKMNERHAAIAAAMQGKAIERLNQLRPDDLSPGQLIVWVEKAAQIERRARGEATEIVKHEDTGGPDLSALSDEELETFEQLLEKARVGSEARDEA